jgi:serine/threonine-protein kinase
MKPALVDRLLQSLPELSVEARLSEGGQKVVYSAHHSQWGNVVLKIIIPGSTAEKERALREIAFAAELESPLFTKPYRFGEFVLDEQTVVYVVEERLPGEPLRQMINKKGRSGLGCHETKRVISSLLAALGLLEPKRLVHRDIKPENIIVSSSRVTLIDFGIARKLDIQSITETYAVFGPMTPGYAPPEQIRNEKRKISWRTDLFAVGVVMYETLVGINPFIENAQSPQEVIRNVLEKEPVSLSARGFHPSVDLFITQCFAKHCHRRPSSIKDAVTLFEEICWEA